MFCSIVPWTSLLTSYCDVDVLWRRIVRSYSDVVVLSTDVTSNDVTSNAVASFKFFVSMRRFFERKMFFDSEPWREKKSSRKNVTNVTNVATTIKTTFLMWRLVGDRSVIILISCRWCDMLKIWKMRLKKCQKTLLDVWPLKVARWI